jgi:predicted Zn finger-like uncharacterized protein
MQTRCPQCETVFRVSEEQLALADGQVRCGECDCIFNARDTLIEEQIEQAGHDTDSRADAFALEPVEFDHEAAQIAIPGLETGQDQAAQDTVDEIDEAVSASAEDEATPITVESSTDDAPDGDSGETSPLSGYDAQVLYPELKQAPPAATSTSLAETLAGIAVIFAMLLLLVAQFAYFQRDSLARHAALRPLLDTLCQVMDCRIASQRAPQQVRLLTHEIMSHPSYPDALSVTAVIVNKADFSQAYPVIRLRFLDVGGHLLAQRDFLPREYLPANVDVSREMRSGEPVNILLELLDPGKKAVSYEFEFL